MTGEWLMQDGMYEYVYYTQVSLTRQAFYHNGGGNYLWADGHAEFKQSGTVTAKDLDRRD
jgi:prepilin-type processing-associated H-X9-DG protein